MALFGSLMSHAHLKGNPVHCSARTAPDACARGSLARTMRKPHDVREEVRVVEGNARTDLQRVSVFGQRVRENIEKVIVGHEATIEMLLVAILCEGHILLEDVPGMGKTKLARTAARSLDCSFRRVQCTPDLMPSDITGIHYFDQRASTFQFRPGPLFAQIVLADEINRATPRTQSALLEAMEERQVTVDGETMPLPRPFLVIATQNPIELEGTFPLPEAQLDRFLLRLSLGYPAEAEEEAMMERFERDEPLLNLQAVATGEDIIAAAEAVLLVRIDPAVRRYALQLVRATRVHATFSLGTSPRGALALIRAARALAALRGRDYVLPDDVKEMVIPVMAHRCLLSNQARLRGHAAVEALQEIMTTIPVPIG